MYVGNERWFLILSGSASRAKCKPLCDFPETFVSAKCSGSRKAKRVCGTIYIGKRRCSMPSNNKKYSEEMREQTAKHIIESGKSATSAVGREKRRGQV